MIRRFVEENFERDVKNFVLNEEIYRTYLSFAKTNGVKEISQIALVKKLNKLGIGKPYRKRINGVPTQVRYGLRLK